jgi:uncharacterized membrane protein YgcG
MRRLLGSGLLLTLALVAIPLPAAADTSDFTFDSFDADYTLSRLSDDTSQLAVVETIVARFPDFDQNRGIIRAIPNTYDGVELNTVVQSVVDENGTDVYYEADDTGDFIELALGTDEFVQGPTTYVISYTQQNVVRSFADTASDEFYWDVNGTGWAQPFGRVTATVRVDPSLETALSGNTACYQGVQDSGTPCADIQSPEPLLYTASANNLGPGENLTVVIGFAAGTFLTPEPVLPPQPLPVPLPYHLLSGLIGLLSLAGLIAAIVARVRAGRGHPGRGTIIPEYSEPPMVTIMQAAHLMKRPTTAIPAAIVRLAVRKNIRILAYAVVPGGEPYTLQYLTSDRANDEDLALITALFGTSPEAGKLREFGQSHQDLATRLQAISSNANLSLEEEGLLRRAPGIGVGILLVLAQVVLAIATFALAGWMFAQFTNVSPWLIASGIVGTAVFVATCALAYRPLQPTAAGAEARDFLLGMHMYLTLAEQDRLRALQSPSGAERVNVDDNRELIKLYEKLLPWAVLWGVEDEWMKELAIRVESEPEQPDWFVGSNGFNAAIFASTVHGFSAAATPPPSTWSSSSGGSTFGGGSFGGGFSGGGGGGGGGGGR